MDIVFSRDDTHSKDDQILYGRRVYNKPPLPFHLSSSSTNNRRGTRKFNGQYSNQQSPNCYIIFLVGNNNQYMPIAWQSKRIKRIVKSTLGAETLAMVDLTEACFYYRKLILDLLLLEDHPMNIKIRCKTDNSCLYDAVHSTTQILDKRLQIEMAVLREMVDRGEIAEISWIPTDKQIADSLTKKGVPSFKILQFISEPKESSVKFSSMQS